MPRDLNIEQLRYALRGREIRREAVIAERMKLDLEIERLQSEIADALALIPMSYPNSPNYGIARREGYRERERERVARPARCVEIADANLESLI